MVAINKYDLMASIYRESFFEFFKAFWPCICPTPMVFNWHIEFLCNEMQIAAERVFANEPKEYDLLVNIPPGTTKSSIMSIAFPPWTWTRMPHARHITASHTDQLVLDLSRKSRDLVESELYQRCFPNIELRPDQNTKGYWSNTLGGDRLCCTIAGKTPTGFHAHFICVDDPLDPKKALSEAEIKTAKLFYDEVIPNRKTNKEVSFTSTTMQRVNKYDPSGHLLEQGGRIRHICLPAELTNKVSPKYLKKRYVNNLLDPKRLPLSVLEENKLRGQYGYAGQFLQDPIPLGGLIFKTDVIPFVKQAPGNVEEIVRYWDKAATTDDGCYTVGVKMAKVREGNYWRYYVLHVLRGQWDAFARERIIKQTAKMDGYDCIQAVEQEPGSGGKESAQATVRNLAGFRVRMDRPKGDKFLRADPYAAQVNGGFVSIVEGPWNAAYLDELQNFCEASPYKDQVDASSGAFNMLVRGRKVGARRT